MLSSVAVIKWPGYFYLRKSKQEYHLDSYSSQRKVQQLLDSPRTLQVQPQAHSTAGLKEILKEVRDADAWALVLPDPGPASATLHTLKERCDGSDWHISSQSVPLQLCYWLWSCFPLPPLSQSFHSHGECVQHLSATHLGFFTCVSVCLSSQVLDKGTNYCGASHHCM